MGWYCHAKGKPSPGERVKASAKEMIRGADLQVESLLYTTA
jgi:hypothetical protein